MLIAAVKWAPIGGVSVLALHQFLIIQAHPTHTPENSRITSYRGGEAGDDDPGGRCGGEEDEGGGGERGDSGGGRRLCSTGRGDAACRGEPAPRSPASLERSSGELCRADLDSTPVSELFSRTQPVVRWHLCKIWFSFWKKEKKNSPSASDVVSSSWQQGQGYEILILFQFNI